MEKTKTLFYHGKTVDDYRFTIAGQFTSLPINGDDQDIDTIRLGASLCSSEDMFEKKVGRVKAEGRMKSNHPFGRNYYSLYRELKPTNWFKDQEIKVFIEAAVINEKLTRKGFMSKFSL